MNRRSYAYAPGSHKPTGVFLALACLFLCGQAPPPMIALPSPAPDAESSPAFRLLAVYAHGDGSSDKEIPEELKGMRDLWDGMPYAKYELLADQRKEAPFAQETLFPVNAIYSLALLPREQDASGAVLLDARVDMLREGDYVRALNSVAQAIPGKALIFRGLPMQSGELVLILALESGQGNGQGNSDETQPPDDLQEEQRQAGESDSEAQEQNEPESDSHEEPSSDRNLDSQAATEQHQDDQTQPRGVDNIEALLQSLEEIDRREQVEERNRRDRIDFMGEWW